MPSGLSNRAPERWRNRANKLRVKAGGTADARSKRAFLNAAQAYERLADEIEARLRRIREAK
jgi:hypothetical protein